MLTRLWGEEFIRKLYVFLFSVMAIALPLNNLTLSISFILLGLISLLNWNKNYLIQLKNYNVLYILLAFILFHLSSLLWTNNYSYFFNDLNVKLSFYLLPFVFIFSPLRHKKELILIKNAFLISVLFAVCFNLVRFYIDDTAYHEDFRNLSFFGSHIRFGLMICLAFFILVFQKYDTRLKKIGAFLYCFILLYYVYISQVFSSLFILLTVSLIVICYRIFANYSNKIKISFSILLLTIFTFIGLSIQKAFELEPIKLYDSSEKGEKYIHFPEIKSYSNKNHVFSNIAEGEIKEVWENRTNTNITDTNRLGYQHYYTILHYLASKGLKKDGKALNSLSDYEIKKILNGKNSILQESSGLKERLQLAVDEINSHNPNDKSIIQRIEYLKNGWYILKNNFVFGVSSGDLNDEIQHAFNQRKSTLVQENRLRIHNQFFTYFVSFGIIGGLLFLILFLNLFKWSYQHCNLHFFIFLSILAISFLSEDTLETQMGATFAGFFIGYYLLNSKYKLNEN